MEQQKVSVDPMHVKAAKQLLRENKIQKEHLKYLTHIGMNDDGTSYATLKMPTGETKLIGEYKANKKFSDPNEAMKDLKEKGRVLKPRITTEDKINEKMKNNWDILNNKKGI